MNTIKQIFTAQHETKKSKFIAFLAPFDKFDEFYAKLKILHPKATHIVWAYRYFNQFYQIIENQNDDNEPKNTAAFPCLNVLRGANLINISALVVRYFGGIKLGTGGLARAYCKSVNLAILNAEFTPFIIKSECKIFVPFHLISQFQHYFEKENLQNLANFTQNGCEFSLYVSQNEFEKVNKFMLKFANNSAQFLSLPLFTII